MLASSIASAQSSPPFAPAATPPENEPPQWVVAEDATTRVHERFSVSYRVEDPEKDPITFTVEGLPASAKAEPTGEGNEIVVSFTPEDRDVGAYEIVLKASDGHQTSERRVKLVVEEEVNSFIMPGLEYALMIPNDDLAGAAKLGVYQGVTARFCVYCWIHRNEKRGPSHGRITIDFDLLASSEKGSSALFISSVGFALTLERNPSRRFLLPFFGANTGIWYHQSTETLGMVFPFAGLYLWSSANLSLTARAGYLLPFSSGRFDQVRGLRAGLGFDIAFW